MFGRRWTLIGCIVIVITRHLHACHLSVVVVEQGRTTEEAAQSASAAEAAAMERAASSLRAELDEFGRDLNVQKRKEVEKRSAYRARRRKVIVRRVRFDLVPCQCL